MMWCGVVGGTGGDAVPFPPPTPPAITLVNVSGNNMMWCGAVGTGVGVGAPPPPLAMSLTTNSSVYNADDDVEEYNSFINKTDKTDENNINNTNKSSNDLGTSIHTSIHSTSSIGRSRLKVEKIICCALETPQIKRILKHIHGINNVMINVSLKIVLIDHDYNTITASGICDILKRQSFPAQIENDAAAIALQGNKKMGTVVPTMTFVTSVFTLSSLMEDSKELQNMVVEEEEEQQQPQDDGADNNRLKHQQEMCEQVRELLGSYEFDEIDTFLLEDNPRMDCSHSDEEYKRDGTSKEVQQSLSKSSPSPRLTVIHNSLLLSVNDLVESIKEKTGTNWIIEKNGTENMKWEFPHFQDFDKREEEELASSRNNNNRWPRPAVILSGIFWVISMLSFLGGNWDYLKYVALLSVALGIPPILIKAIRTLRRFQFDTNCLMLFAVIGALALKAFSEAAAVTFLYALSDWLEVRATT